MSAAAVKAASTSMVWSTGAGAVFNAATTVATNGAQIAQGWAQLRIKEADMASQIPGKVTIPPIVRPG